MLDVAKKYHNHNLSVIPVNEKKIPIGGWKENQKRRIEPNGQFNNSYGIGIVCGAVSGNLECIDIDSKYDLTGTLWKHYCRIVKEQDEFLLKKLVIEKSPSGGYHLIYRCKEIEGNKKLANRYTTDSEKKENPKEKVRVLIETRGEGGYFMCHPSPGYKLLQGSLDAVPEITVQERSILFYCARIFNEVYEKPVIRSEYTRVICDNISPFDDYNKRGDVLRLLEEEGWTIKKKIGTKHLLLRPGGTGVWSADWDSDKRLLYVWTTSSEFESNRAYNPSQILTVLKFGGNYSASVKWLKQNNYGVQQKPETAKRKKVTIKLEEGDLSFALKTKHVEEYLEQVIDGSFKMGLSTGFPKLDEYFRFKDNSLVINLGFDNVGKTIVILYFAVLSARLHGWKWLLYSAENKPGGIFRKLIEFYMSKNIRRMTPEELAVAKDWVDEHFTLIYTRDAVTYADLLLMAEKLLKKEQYNSLLIDPYNSLHREKDRNENVHDYDYDTLGEMRRWIDKNNCSIYINIHAFTDAGRRVYPKDHPRYPGMLMPPRKADTEGGAKFANRADDFIIMHRQTEHEQDYIWTQIHIRKIKECETGGRQTPLDRPFMIKLVCEGAGFEDEDGYNPVLFMDRKVFEQQDEAPPMIRDFSIPIKIEEDDIGF